MLNILQERLATSGNNRRETKTIEKNGISRDKKYMISTIWNLFDELMWSGHSVPALMSIELIKSETDEHRHKNLQQNIVNQIK